MGLRFHGPSAEPPNRVPRMHNVVPNAKAYIATLEARLLCLGGRIVTGAVVKELCWTDRRVTGVIANVNGRRVRCNAHRGIVLAAGDYANNSEMISTNTGEQLFAIEGINPHATGDGHRLAQSAGAKLVNMAVTYGPELRFVPSSQEPFRQLLPSNGLAARVMGRLLPVMPSVCTDGNNQTTAGHVAASGEFTVRRRSNTREHRWSSLLR